MGFGSDKPFDKGAPAWVRPHQVLLSQLPVVVLLMLVGLPMFSPAWSLGWSGLILGMALAEGFACAAAARRAGWIWQALGVGSTFLTSFAYAFAAMAIMEQHVPAANLFVFALLASSMTYVLLRYYQRPWAFVVAIAPQILLLGLVGVTLALPPIRAGHYLQAAPPLATSGLFILMFWAARAQLAGAWKALVDREQAAAAANAAKSDFLATMSHEIRTPLNGVLGMAQAMTTDELAAVQRERLKVIRRSGEDLLAILNDVLDLSKIESGALSLETAEFDIEHLARGAVATFAYETHKKGIGFHFALADEARGAYLGDPTRVRQVIYNLTSNAVKFTHVGEVTVSIVRLGEGLRIDVGDTGVGIAPDKLKTLFDKFVQADGSATRRFGGAGLGLAITRELVTLMGGEIFVRSTPGLGSTFTVELPEVRRIPTANLNAPAQTEPEAVVEKAAPQEAPAELRVLAAEDNKVNQMVLKTLLAQAGVDVTMVENGRLALETWEAAHWDIILMDIQMPEMDGLAAARAIREREAQTGRVRTPILAVTANAMAHQVAEYDAAGMDGHVPKPIEAARLFAAMEEALDQAAERDASQQGSSAAA